MNRSVDPAFVRIPVARLPHIIRRGWQLFLKTRPLSVSFAMIFALIGVAILASIMRASYAPFVFPVSGGFMLVGPFLLAGFFSLADRVNQGEECSAADIRTGFARTTGGVWVIAFVCTLLFVVWMINAAYLYGGIIGRTPQPLISLLAPSPNVLLFLLVSSLFGSVLAFFVFAISAFSVPLLYYRRATFWSAVTLSVRAVFANLVPCLAWALILTLTIIGSIVVFPMFLLAFPVVAYASHSLYREIFPD